MNQIPYIVVVSSSSTKPKSLIRLITDNSNSDNEQEEINKISKKWNIDTKYYSAEVELVGISDDYQRTDEFNENVEALIIHMDSNSTTGLEDLKKWESLENDCSPEVMILVSNYFTAETKISRNKATEWCIQRGYELIELYPQNKIITDESEHIIEEKTGVERIVEALQAHMWPNLIMKEKDIGKLSVKKSKKENRNTREHLVVDDGLEEFTDLFQKLHTMKDSMQSMPMHQRRQCAEQMVTAFWKAVGGEEDEIADL